MRVCELCMNFILTFLDKFKACEKPHSKLKFEYFVFDSKHSRQTCIRNIVCVNTFKFIKKVHSSLSCEQELLQVMFAPFHLYNQKLTIHVAAHVCSTLDFESIGVMEVSVRPKSACQKRKCLNMILTLFLHEKNEISIIRKYSENGEFQGIINMKNNPITQKRCVY